MEKEGEREKTPDSLCFLWLFIWKIRLFFFFLPQVAGIFVYLLVMCKTPFPGSWCISSHLFYLSSKTSVFSLTAMVFQNWKGFAGHLVPIQSLNPSPCLAKFNQNHSVTIGTHTHTHNSPTAGIYQVQPVKLEELYLLLGWRTKSLSKLPKLPLITGPLYMLLPLFTSRAYLNSLKLQSCAGYSLYGLPSVDY